MHDYEANDRKQRKKEEERRKLLEKNRAKIKKGRKGKGKKGADVAHANAGHGVGGPADQGQIPGAYPEEYYGDGDEDDYDADDGYVPPPPAAPPMPGQGQMASGGVQMDPGIVGPPEGQGAQKVGGGVAAREA